MNFNSRKMTAFLAEALLEDQATRDATTLAIIDPQQKAMATILAKQDCVLSGIALVRRIYEIFAELEGESQGYPEVRIPQEIFDGVHLHKGENVASIRHSARVLLSCERLILNLLQHLSGIATVTRAYVDAIEGTGARILDTRKTVPGLRQLEKYAVRCGGGCNHRLTLGDGVLLKENHIAAAGGILPAVLAARGAAPLLARIEVEVETLDQLSQCLAIPDIDGVLLDNMDVDTMGRAVAMRQAAGSRVFLEASGNITLDRARAVAGTGVDFLSVGALTHSAPAADLSLRLA